MVATPIYYYYYYYLFFIVIIIIMCVCRKSFSDYSSMSFDQPTKNHFPNTKCRSRLHRRNKHLRRIINVFALRHLYNLQLFWIHLLAFHWHRISSNSNSSVSNGNTYYYYYYCLSFSLHSLSSWQSHLLTFTSRLHHLSNQKSTTSILRRKRVVIIWIVLSVEYRNSITTTYCSCESQIHLSPPQAFVIANNL